MLGRGLDDAVRGAGVVSVCATAAGLALGERLGGYAERYAAFLGGVLLALTGATFILLKILRVG